MSALTWNSWSAEWSLQEKVTFNGNTRKIHIFPEVTVLDFRADIYAAWVRWLENDMNNRFLPAMRYIGLDLTGPGEYSGAMFFLLNGWQIVVDHQIQQIEGIVYHDDGIPVFDIRDGGGVSNKVASLAYAYSKDLSSSNIDAIAEKIKSELPAYPTAEDIASAVIAILPSGVTPEQVAQAVWNHTQ